MATEENKRPSSGSILRQMRRGRTGQGNQEGVTSEVGGKPGEGSGVKSFLEGVVSYNVCCWQVRYDEDRECTLDSAMWSHQ